MTIASTDPGIYSTHHAHLATLAYQQGNLQHSLYHLQQLVRFNPQDARAHYNLGNLFHDLQQFPQAIASYQRAILYNPTYLEAYGNLGTLYHQQGEHAKAITCYQQALAINLNRPELHLYLGNALKKLLKLEEADICYQTALQLNPNYLEAHEQQGQLLQELGYLSEAQTHYQKVLELNPQFLHLQSNIAETLKQQGQIKASLALYQQLLQEIAHQQIYHDLIPFIHSNLLLTFHYDPDCSQTDLAAHCQAFDQRYCLPLATQILPRLPSQSTSKKLKIAYVSADFHRHPVAYFIGPILKQHDHDQFEVFCYYNNLHFDEITQELQKQADHWINCLQFSNQELVHHIRQHSIDILVDLAGHTSGHRLLVFAQKPAPIQITYLGYPDTTGLSSMDYHLTDQYVDPPQQSNFGTEIPLYLPHSYFCYEPAPEAHQVPVNPLPALHNGFVTFAVLNNFVKLNPFLLNLWANLLKRLPQAKLFIKSKNLKDPVTRHHLIEHFIQQDIALQRLILVESVPKMADYLQLYHQLDIALDTYPYNGATTTCETLWMGLPVVTLVGNNHAARMGLSLLSTVGLTDWIAHTPDDYLDICCQLANNLNQLQQIRSQLRSRLQNSPLMDAKTFTRQLEGLYQHCWKTYFSSSNL